MITAIALSAAAIWLLTVAGIIRLFIIRSRSAWPPVHEHVARRHITAADTLPVREGMADIADRTGMAWPPRDCEPGRECSIWDPRGDRPVAFWCRRHCPDCRDDNRGHPVPCVVHDRALWDSMERLTTE